MAVLSKKLLCPGEHFMFSRNTWTPLFPKGTFRQKYFLYWENDFFCDLFWRKSIIHIKPWRSAVYPSLLKCFQSFVVVLHVYCSPEVTYLCFSICRRSRVTNLVGALRTPECLNPVSLFLADQGFLLRYLSIDRMNPHHQKCLYEVEFVIFFCCLKFGNIYF